MKKSLILIGLLFLSAAFAKEPSISELGTELYPDARYNEQYTKDQVGKNYVPYVYLSKDEFEKVVKFYETKLGSPHKVTQEAYVFAIKGKLPKPAQGVSVQRIKEVELENGNKTYLEFYKSGQE